MTDIGLAVNREFSANNERRKDTTFVDVTVWARQAEVICEYLKRGDPLFVEGRLVTDSWETPEGQKRSRLKIVAENFQFLGGRRGSDDSFEGGGRMQGGDYNSDFRGAGGRGAAPAPTGTGAGEGPADEGGLGVDDSDIPF